MDAEHLRYRFLNEWNAALQALDQKHSFLSSSHLIVSYSNDKEQVGSNTQLIECVLSCAFSICTCQRMIFIHEEEGI